MGDAGQSHHHHHHGFQPQLLSFGGGGGAQHHVHQFAAQAQAPSAASHSRSRGGAAAGGEIVAATSASHSRVRGSGGGEIVAVQGGHIVRSTGRKDRHSKVCTARGPRDRRVRLSAHTAIQFYDVQDRLGYDRPSKAVDWLIKNAKDAIDKLEVLPAWQPTAAAANANAAAAPPSSSTHPDSADNSDDKAQAITVAHTSFDFPGARGASGGGASGTGFLPPSLDSDSIADTIKSFFPMAGTAGGEASSSTAAAQSSAMGGFQSYTHDLLSRTGSHSQELRLSLQPLPDPMFHQQQDRSHAYGGNGSAQQALFPGYSFGGGAMWAAEQAQGQRMLPWNVPDPGGGSTTGGYLFNVSQQAALAGQSQFFFQRGPLQSSNLPSDRGWPETVEADNPMQQQQHQHQGGLSPAVFAPGIGFSGFRIPTRIQGDEEHNDGGNGDKPPPPSVSSASHH
ncbi:transcription factor PCF5-like [Panicum virgatum]|uniref:TCP domain-containing protein n=1 Tax=Panicum virgatum TaxID=38727 RepID=A0A8T0SDD8_PANVG|nr:transcription factor PCF5-like [Panicum virgatum]XP_039845981.1 transcription factor PCF5-like [Panicum virgatum]KAG2594903.1 hypothetical protein PVAP13_5KG034501 [Panicum virgatum]KAG2594904.1 hypothetical protein PVAP13_5KG034501 [Panicum virgatum]KAG2594905.1 hypothetical protein PVAP13_5KG034501 [Panicum virgatum]KAG2594906.1 hypothetical protein PVAP13_5KG034501 [Panicum virgatum]KAG2594907.1 hypothetical protein PVAP13_5KG034501 [Panicum virgatum]